MAMALSRPHDVMKVRRCLSDGSWVWRVAGNWSNAAEKSLEASKKASDGLLSTRGLLLSDRYDTVVEFRKHFYDTGQFFKPFADNFFRAVDEPIQGVTPERARQRVEETTLFIEQAQTVYTQS